MIEHFLTQEWEIHRYGESTDPYENPVDGWNYKETVDGLLRPLSGDLRNTEESRHGEVDAKFYCGAGIDIRTGDLLKRSGDAYDYEVVFVQNPMSMDRFLQVEVKRKWQE